MFSFTQIRTAGRLIARGLVVPMAIVTLAACEDTRQPTAPAMNATEGPSYAKGGNGGGGSATFGFRAYAHIPSWGGVQAGGSGITGATMPETGRYCVQFDPAAFPGGSPSFGIAVAAVHPVNGGGSVTGSANAIYLDRLLAHDCPANSVVVLVSTSTNKINHSFNIMLM